MTNDRVIIFWTDYLYFRLILLGKIYLKNNFLYAIL